MIYDLAIIGGGPSGMMAAINGVNYFNINKNNKNDNDNKHKNDHNSVNKFNVIILEKNNQFGKKLLLSGGGRCNIANALPIKEQVAKFDSTGNITKNFIKNILFSFTNNGILSFFENKGVNFKIEYNNRYITESGNSQDILDVLKSTINDLSIETIFNFDVDNITYNNENNEDNDNNGNDNNSNYNITNAENTTIKSNNIIIATGASSYPKTGSTGKGYELARNFNHDINKVIPGLIPLKINSNYFNKYFKDLSGLTFENVTVSFNKIANNNSNSNSKNENENKKDSSQSKNNTKDMKVEESGNVLISHNGITGPAILNISNDIIKSVNFTNDNNEFEVPITINIDFVPNSNEESLRTKFIDDSTESGKTKVKNYMKYYLPNRFISKFLEIANISENRTLANLNKKSGNNIIQNLKKFPIDIIGTFKNNKAMISLGGVDLNEINTKTLESKISPNLYFVGELLDIHGPTGGYNLQIAFSTGYLAGESVAKKYIQ